MLNLKVKQIRLVTYVLGIIASLLLGVLGFRFLGEYLTSRASNAAPQNLSITDITQNAATVKWTTDQETQVVIEYGTTPTSLTFFAPEATKTKEHRVELNLLTSTTTYYFQIKSGDKIYDNGGVPWTFTTLAEGETTPSPTVTATSPTDIETTPTIELSPTVNPADVEKDTNCDLNDYKNRFYTTSPEYDQDNNGIVNLRDWSLCNATNGNLTPTITPSPTP